MVEQARERAIEEGLEEKVAFQIADALELPFEESTFDAVIGESVLAFIEDKSRALSELVRVTKSQGYVWFNEGSWIKTPPSSLAKYIFDVLGAVFLTPDEWHGIWKRTGLKEVTMKSYKVRALEQWGYEFRGLELREYFGAWYKFVRLLFTSPECRRWARKTLSMPRNIFAAFKYFGYGIYVGKKLMANVEDPNI